MRKLRDLPHAATRQKVHPQGHNSRAGSARRQASLHPGPYRPEARTQRRLAPASWTSAPPRRNSTTPMKAARGSKSRKKRRKAKNQVNSGLRSIRYGTKWTGHISTCIERMPRLHMTRYPYRSSRMDICAQWITPTGLQPIT